MNDIQGLITQLRAKGWTISAIADALGVSREAADSWRSGKRYPGTAQAVRHELERLLAKKRIPKQKRYIMKGAGGNVTKTAC